MTEGQTQEWKVYFGKLEAEGYFDGGETDKSSLQYLYMDMIRSHIHRFVEVHIFIDLLKFTIPIQFDFSVIANIISLLVSHFFFITILKVVEIIKRRLMKQC